MIGSEWDEACAVLSLSLNPETRVDLERRYSEPHRAYHTMQHLSECFSRLREVQTQVKLRQFAVLALALWFHDAVYDTHRGDNELASAELARLHLMQAGANQNLVDEVATLVLATKHDVCPTSPTCQWIVDIDLAILAAPAARFDEYETQIRREYEWVRESDFRAGRSQILRQFLDRPHIFGTTYFRDRYEELARANLLRSLARLG